MDAKSGACRAVLFSLIFLLFMSNTLATGPAASTSCKNSYTKFIRTACNSTIYPGVCYKSLSSYASDIETNPLKLCTTSLTLTMETARNASSMVKKLAKKKGLSPTETAIIQDCIENIGDSIDELKQSVYEMGSLEGPDAKFHVANIRTWVSAALTDEDTCTDGFEGKKVSSSVKKKIRTAIVNLAKMTSNSLALFNLLSY